MTSDITIRSLVDSDLLDRIENECYQILYQQRLRYNQRWVSLFEFKKVSAVLRLVALTTSVLGVLLSLFYLVYPSVCPRYYFAEIFLALFAGFAVFFYYLPRLEARYVSFLKKAGSKSCKRMAKRFLLKARKVVPYVAEYRIKGDLVTFYRGQEMVTHIRFGVSI